MCSLGAGLRAEARARGIGNLLFRPYQPDERLPESLAVPDVHLVVLRPEMEGLIVPSKFYGIAAAGQPMIFVDSRDGEGAGLLASGEAGFALLRGMVQGWRGLFSGCETIWSCASARGATLGGCARSGSRGGRLWRGGGKF